MYLQQILKNRVQIRLEPKRCLKLFEAFYKVFRAYSQKWFPEVSKTFSRNAHKGFRAVSQIRFPELSRPFAKFLKQILKHVQLCL